LKGLGFILEVGVAHFHRMNAFLSHRHHGLFSILQTQFPIMFNDLGGCNPIHLWHSYIHQYYVGLKGFDLCDRLSTVARLAHYLKVRLRF
jgi:hypothetical protein